MKSLNWPLVFAGLLPWASLAAAALFSPRLSRPDIFFAITVSPAFRESAAGREILRKYDRAVIIIALLALLVIGFVQLGTTALVMAGLLGPVFIELAGWFIAFLTARRRTAPYHVEPAPQREAALQPRQISLPGGWVAQMGPFLILAGAVLWLILHWDGIPARIPVHWGIQGTPDRWASKSPAAVFGTAAIGAMICLLISALWYATLRGARRIYSSGSRAAHEKHFQRAVSCFLLGMEYWLALLMGLLSLAALRPHPEAPMPALLPILLGQTVLIAIIFAIIFRAGQGGWRLESAEENRMADTPPVGDRTPDECWKLGMFYFNANDPALFVEKRFGIGWTVNLANPRAWLVLAAILLFMAACLGLALLVK